MKTLRIKGHVGDDHRLVATVPESVPSGPVDVDLVLPQEHEVDWMRLIAREWRDELADPAQDIYTLEDGEPADEGR